MKQFARCALLAVLSAIVAEFLLGDEWLTGVPPATTQIAELLLYACFYGSAAILIREFARRSGRGWPSILLLAGAFGVIEEGIVDQSLFNPNFAGEHLLANGFIPALAIGGPWTIFVLSLHVIWSIGVPIAIVEGVFPRPLAGRQAKSPQAQAPWLRLPGLVIAAVLYLFGGTAIFLVFATKGFMASGAQLGVSLLLAVIAIVIALRLPRARPRSARNPWIAAAVGVVFTTLFMLSDRLGSGVSPWLTSLLELVFLGGGAFVAARFRLDTFGLGAGAILTYAWLGMSKAVPLGAGPIVEQSVIVIAVLCVVVVAATRRRAVATAAAGPALR
jgi:uncharacterized membrane protein SirB2